MMSNEGGYVNDPDDFGAATNYGVTQGAWDTYARRVVPSKVGKHPSTLTFDEAEAFWLDRLKGLNVAQADPYTRLALLDFDGQSGGAMRELRQMLGTLKVLTPKLRDQQPVKWTPSTSLNTKFSNDEAAAFIQAGPMWGQLVIVLARVLYLSYLTDLWLQRFKARAATPPGQTKPALAGLHPKYTMGSLYRTLSKENLKGIPLSLSAVIAELTGAHLASIVRKHGSTSIPISTGTDRTVANLLDVNRSNFMFRNTDLIEPGRKGFREYLA